MLMLWLILCIITAGIYSITAFLDNYITDVIFKNKKPQALKVFNGATYLVFALLTAVLFNIDEVPLLNIGLFMLSGVLASVSSIPYYIALKNEEATGAAIFYQIQPLFYLLAGALFFHEAISVPQIIALIIIMIAPAIIILSRKHKKSRQMQIRAGALLVLYVFLLALSGIISTHAGNENNYTTFFVYFLLGRGLSDVALSLANPSWRKRFKEVTTKKPLQSLGVIALNQLLCIAAEFTSRLALILGVAAVVSALTNSLELILTFLLGIILTKRWPKFGREHLHRHIVIAHLIGTVLCVAGIIILQIAEGV